MNVRIRAEPYILMKLKLPGVVHQIDGRLGEQNFPFGFYQTSANRTSDSLEIQTFQKRHLTVR